MKRIIKMLLAPFALLSLVIGASLVIHNTNIPTDVKAADYNGNVLTFSKTGMANAETLVSLNMDEYWIISGDANGNSNPPKYYSSGSALRMYKDNIITIGPSATNTDKVLTKVTFTTLSSYAPAIRVKVGNTLQTMTVVSGAAFSNLAYTYTDVDGFKYISLENAVTSGTTQVRLPSIGYDYRDDLTEYDPVISLDSNFSETELAIGQEYTFAPTILPATALQGFTIESASSAITITGSKFTVLEEAENIELVIKTMGENSSGVPLTETVIFSTYQATTTVAEALTLVPDGKIIYHVEDALVFDGRNTTESREIQLVDRGDATKKILIFQYDMNPLNSYKYIGGGEITFKATLGAYKGVNQFTNPTILTYSDAVNEFAASILTGDVEGQCEERFAAYKEQVLGFTAIELDKLKLGTEKNIVDARARYLAWAANQNENPYSATPLSGTKLTTNNSRNIVMAVVIIGTLGLTTMLGYYFLKKRS